MRRAFAAWLAITVVVAGLWVPFYVAAVRAYRADLESYRTAVLEWQKYKEAQEARRQALDAYEKAKEAWLKSDEAARYREQLIRQEITIQRMRYPGLYENRLVTYDDLLPTHRLRVEEALNKKAEEVAAKVLGGVPSREVIPAPQVDPAKLQVRVDADRRNLSKVFMGGYTYCLLSLGYWILVWGFSKRTGEAESTKPGEKDESTAL